MLLVNQGTLEVACPRMLEVEECRQETGYIFRCMPWLNQVLLRQPTPNILIHIRYGGDVVAFGVSKQQLIAVMTACRQYALSLLDMMTML